MNRLAPLSLLIATLLIGCGPKVERTVDQNRAWTEHYLNKHILAVSFSSGRVAFVTDGEVGIFDKDTHWQKEFTLINGQSFQSQPDHHASSIFELKEVKPKGVVLKYSNKFNNVSFGKNLISIDEGEIEVPYSNRS